jgi:hypothetical protein
VFGGVGVGWLVFYPWVQQNVGCRTAAARVELYAAPCTVRFLGDPGSRFLVEKVFSVFRLLRISP